MNLISAAHHAGLPLDEQISYGRAVILLGHSATIGAVLAITTACVTLALKAKSSKSQQPSDLIMASANVMFLAFGMTGVMMVVNNNIARAFAIGAAMALIRFRIKVDTKTVNMGLFYGVLTGMAVGIDQVPIAYAISFFFAIVQSILVTVGRFADDRVDNGKEVEALNSTDAMIAAKTALSAGASQSSANN
jgi:hypothetical protein